MVVVSVVLVFVSFQTGDPAHFRFTSWSAFGYVSFPTFSSLILFSYSTFDWCMCDLLRQLIWVCCGFLMFSLFIPLAVILFTLIVRSSLTRVACCEPSLFPSIFPLVVRQSILFEARYPEHPFFRHPLLDLFLVLFFLSSCSRSLRLLTIRLGHLST